MAVESPSGAYYLSTDRFTSAFQTNHYGLSMRPDRMAEWATEAVPVVRKLVGDLTPIFCYAGFSGAAHATVLATFYQQQYPEPFGMLYVRKKFDKKNHGEKVQHAVSHLGQTKTMLVFVDDMIETGDTRSRVLEMSKTYLKQRGKDDGNNYLENLDPNYYLCVENTCIAMRDFIGHGVASPSEVDYVRDYRTGEAPTDKSDALVLCGSDSGRMTKALDERMKMIMTTPPPFENVCAWKALCETMKELPQPTTTYDPTFLHD